MNNLFNIKRFGHVFKKDLLENYKRYLLSFVTLMGIMVIIMAFQPWDNRSLLTYMSLLFLAAGILFASTFMNPMNSKLKRISYLVNPASNIEKFLTRWLITTIGYILVFFVALWIADVIKVAVCTVIYPDSNIQLLDLSKLRYPGDDYINYEYMLLRHPFDIMIFIYLLLQSIFLLGSTFWEKASFLKTFTALSITIFSYNMICRWIIFLFYEKFDGFNNVIGSFNPATTMEQAVTFACLVMSFFTLANWTLAFFRIRESEIIKRI